MGETSNTSNALIIAQIVRFLLMAISSYIIIKGNKKNIVKISITILVVSLIILILDNLPEADDNKKCDCCKKQQGFYVSQYEDEPLVKCPPSYGSDYYIDPNSLNTNTARSDTINSNMDINDDDAAAKSIVKRAPSAFPHRFAPELGKNGNSMDSPWDNKIKKISFNAKELLISLKKPMKSGVLSYLK